MLTGYLKLKLGVRQKDPAPAITPVAIDNTMENNTEDLYSLRISKPIWIPLILFFILKY